MEKNINVHIKDRVARAEGDPVIICGNGDYTVTFSFDEEWGGANVKTARFKFNTAEGPEHIDQPFTGDTVDVPELSDIREVEVGVFVGDLNTTTGASIRCKPCIRCGSGAPKDPTPDVYDELMELINDMKEPDEIPDDAITEKKLTDGCVTSDKIAESAVGGQHIENEAIDGHHIKNDSIGDGHLCDWAVTESKLFKDAVTTEKIKDGAVTADKLAEDYLPSDTAIPSALSDLSEDSAHRLVTDEEKESWNAKPTQAELETLKNSHYLEIESELVDPINEQVAGFYKVLENNTMTLMGSNYHYKMNVKAGEKYKISTICGSDLRAYILADFDGMVLDAAEKEAWNTFHDYDIELEIEKDCVLIINSIKHHKIFFYKTKRINKVVNNKLFGKTLSCEGDSIMYGAGYEGGFAKIIADRNGMTLVNNAVSGATLASGTYYSDTGNARHWIASSFEGLPVSDYIIFNGGVNDKSLSGNGEAVPLIGEMSAQYDAELDLTTTIGGLEHCCKLLRTKYVECKAGFIFPHRIWHHGSPWDTLYRIKMKEVLEKWGVPYLDLAGITPPLNRINELKTAYTRNGDGWHPNELGYKLFYCEAIEEWLKTL